MDIGKLSGKQIDEYELVLLIGEGGMSAVYRAYQEELDRYVAFKILSETLAAQPDYRERFDREAKMAASLEHSNIVPVYDFGTFDNSAYVVMRLLNGGTLTDRMQGDRQLTAGEIIAVVTHVARALDYAHKRGIVHRDIKPSNIMFDEQGGIYLVDFGIAKAATADVSLTADNIVLGTPTYMAPEQWRNETPTPAIDQYALAVITYKMLTGEAPFDGGTPHQLMYQHLNDPPPPPHERNPNIPSGVSRALDRALAKQPEARYPDAGSFARALRQALSSIDSEQTVPTPRQQSTPQPAASETVPHIPVVTPPPAAAPSRPAQHPPRQAYARTPQRKESGDKTLLMQVAAGGSIGLVLLLLLVVVFAFAFISIFDLGGGDDDDTEEVAATTVVDTEQEVAQESPTDPSTSGGDSFQITPIIETNIDLPAFGEPLTVFNEPETPVRDVDYSADGTMIASAHGDGLVRIWRGTSQSPTVLRGHTDVVHSVSFSPDGSLLVSAGRDRTARVWDVASGTTRFTLTGHVGSIRDVRFNADGTLIATASEDATARIWNAGTGNLVRSLTVDASRALSVAFSPDGNMIATGGELGTLTVWDANTGGRLFGLTGHGESVRGLDFSPDSTLLASSSTDDSVRIWQLDTRQTRHLMTETGRDVWTVTFNPDGNMVVSGGRDNNIRLWDVNTGGLIGTLTGHAGWVLGLDFTPDGLTLVSGSGDGTVRLWAINP